MGDSMVFIEENISLYREHPHLALKDRTSIGESAEGLDQTSLDPFQKIQNSWDAIHVHIIDELEKGGVDSWGEENGDGLHGASVQDTRRRARSRKLTK